MSRKEIIDSIKYNLDVAHSMGSNKKTIKKLNKQLQKEMKLK
jgi:hypothetical protein